MRSAVPLSDRCHGRWHSILSALGVEARILNRKNQPCPMCGGKDRFRWTNHNEDGGYFCSGCGSGDGITFVQAVFKVDFREAAAKIESIVGGCDLDRAPKRDDDKNLTAMRTVWGLGHAIRHDDAVGRYLIGRRLELPAYPKCLRYVPRLRHEAGGAPAMIAQVLSPEGRAVNVHRTWLTDDGRKADIEVNRKLMAGSLPDGSAIRLFPATDVLGVAEGIETAIAAHLLFGVPVWSVISEGGIQKFRPPAGVERLIIFGDNDVSFVGQAAAHIAARDIRRACEREGRPIEVSIHIPDAPGSDWADHLEAIETAKRTAA